MSRRKYVRRRIHVAVVLGLALLAGPPALGQVQLGLDPTAAATALGRGVEALDHPDLLGTAAGASVPLRLVAELADHLAPARVADGLGQRAVADHVLDGEVLHHNHIIFPNEPGRELVEEVLPPPPHPRVEAGHLPAGLLPIRAPLHLAAEVPLRPLELGEVAPQVPGVPALPYPPEVVHGDRHVGQAKVNADATLGSRVGLGVDHHSEGHEVAARAVARDRDGLGGRGKWPAPPDLERGLHLGEQNEGLPLRAAVAEPVPARGVLGALLAAPGLEAGEPGFFSEELLVGRVEVPERLLDGHAGDLVQPRVVVGLLEGGEPLGGVAVREGDVLVVVGVAPEPERPVERKPGAPKLTGKHLCLLASREETVAVPGVHANNLTAAGAVCVSQFQGWHSETVSPVKGRFLQRVNPLVSSPLPSCAFFS